MKIKGLSTIHSKTHGKERTKERVTGVGFSRKDMESETENISELTVNRTVVVNKKDEIKWEISR